MKLIRDDNNNIIKYMGMIIRMPDVKLNPPTIYYSVDSSAEYGGYFFIENVDFRADGIVVKSQGVPAFYLNREMLADYWNHMGDIARSHITPNQDGYYEITAAAYAIDDANWSTIESEPSNTLLIPAPEDSNNED